MLQSSFSITPSDVSTSEPQPYLFSRPEPMGSAPNQAVLQGGDMAAASHNKVQQSYETQSDDGVLLTPDSTFARHFDPSIFFPAGFSSKPDFQQLDRNECHGYGLGKFTVSPYARLPNHTDTRTALSCRPLPVPIRYKK